MREGGGPCTKCVDLLWMWALDGNITPDVGYERSIYAGWIFEHIRTS